MRLLNWNDDFPQWRYSKDGKVFFSGSCFPHWLIYRKEVVFCVILTSLISVRKCNVAVLGSFRRHTFRRQIFLRKTFKVIYFAEGHFDKCKNKKNVCICLQNTKCVLKLYEWVVKKCSLIGSLELFLSIFLNYLCKFPEIYN